MGESSFTPGQLDQMAAWQPCLADGSQPVVHIASLPCPVQGLDWAPVYALGVSSGGAFALKLARVTKVGE